ncbi:MAG TPA: hypothetical protein VK208_00250 [Pyrinomonadaceae bacterium]|jgi:hypothetical protein|nr:hypothetical protein [Pyrinomonadaceae bacterium]
MDAEADFKQLNRQWIIHDETKMTVDPPLDARVACEPDYRERVLLQ